MTSSTKKTPLKIDWGKFNPDVTKDLFKPLPDTRLPVVRMAQELERKMFTYMLFCGLSKIYVWTETHVNGNTWSMEWHFDDHRPSYSYCTEHDFSNLINMSDEEFNALPPSPNSGLVKSWREIMRNRK